MKRLPSGTASGGTAFMGGGVYTLASGWVGVAGGRVLSTGPSCGLDVPLASFWATALSARTSSNAQTDAVHLNFMGNTSWVPDIQFFVRKGEAGQTGHSPASTTIFNP
jgi:hypothetical protein